MNWWQALILGIVQGLTEFLPVSSSGHLILFQTALGVEGDFLLFNVMLHVGTLIAVFIVLWPEIWSILKRPFQKLTGMVLLSSIPLAIIGLLFHDSFDRVMEGGTLAYGFIGTAVVLVAASLIRGRDIEVERMGPLQALVVGAGQGLAVLPGLSRSGTTLFSGIASGLERSFAARYAMLISIPAILGPAAFEAYDLIKAPAQALAAPVPWGAILLGMAASAVCGAMAMKWLFSLARENRLWVFSVYVGLMGVLVLLDQTFFHLIF